MIDQLRKKNRFQKRFFRLGTIRKKFCVWALNHKIDIVILSSIILIAGIACYLGSRLVDLAVLDFQAENTWFEADLNRVFQNMTDHRSDHQRTKVHPLFSIIAFSPTYLIRKILGVSEIVAVRSVIAVVAAFWAGGLFALLRLMGCRRLDAMTFTALGSVSAASMFWFVIPETYPFGSLTIILGLIFAALTEYYTFPTLIFAIASAVTLSITITNWMVGILATLANYSWRRTIQISVNAFFLTTLVWGIQKIVFSSSEFFLGSREERKYISFSDGGGPLHVLKSFFAHTMVMPKIELGENVSTYFDRPDWPVMFTQSSPPGSASFWGAIAVGLWIALIALGGWSLLTLKSYPRLRMVVGLALVGQLLLHSVYGNETFLYSLHFVPILIALVAFSLLTKFRPLALLLAGALVFTAALNNGMQFQQVREFLWTHGSPRHLVQAQMKLRPLDPWPKSYGHVVLGFPGSREADKAYHEPGGSFSPSVGSFGVSIWKFSSKGELRLTSDTIPLENIEQEFIHADNFTNAEIPKILTKADGYQTIWSLPKPQQSQLDLQVNNDFDEQFAVAIRSVGPAGGAIESLNWDGNSLTINERWVVTVTPQPSEIYLGSEGSNGWSTNSSVKNSWMSEDGWGFAQIRLGSATNWTLVINDQGTSPPTELQVSDQKSRLQLRLPDQTFIDSIKAQMDHIRMGIVNREPRPGDPTTYPLPWLRDGAYEIVALARSGQLELAQQLSTDFAEQDFFGGFGPEADAPGLAIWALSEVSEKLQDVNYDQWLWPHIYRKVGLIQEMLTAERPIRKPIMAPIVPRVKNDPEKNLVAEASRDGLIIGRMDHHRPLLYVNAVSYAGLLHAADLAERMNHPEKAMTWRVQAKQLQQSWEAAFQTTESDNERTYMSGLWPTWIAASKSQPFAQKLKERWNSQRDDKGNFIKQPLWTYFTVAEAHQWLILNQPQRVWKTLKWFWDHQSSSGLYTWWEGGQSAESSSSLWPRVRGWVDPPNITPHYWTAAEMLLLQLDMLAYVDHSVPQPTLVVGPGVPEAWLKQPLSVENLFTESHRISWEWDGQQVLVDIQGPPLNIELGNAFPKGTNVLVRKNQGISQNVKLSDMKKS